eukprot:CAMPEP_0118644332 /NCGR_PEP_ID=MMETSP0785-20121206/6888_1 /TAXON_ID=91992 /ORGANISM="Bolidomonas pacifica, Strain CCMP 1866" /LENGTH=97 /DNA_ID=CAMNT_0006536095 /DNA_START=688 /DNA_END=978 /DNA_ORIENTATION=-
MTKEEFDTCASDHKLVVAILFPRAPAVAGYIAEWKAKKYNNKTLKISARHWVEYSSEGNPEAIFGPITTWDVSEVTSMKGLFEGAKDFNEDIRSWDV